MFHTRDMTFRCLRCNEQVGWDDLQLCSCDFDNKDLDTMKCEDIYVKTKDPKTWALCKFCFNAKHTNFYDLPDAVKIDLISCYSEPMEPTNTIKMYIRVKSPFEHYFHRRDIRRITCLEENDQYIRDMVVIYMKILEDDKTDPQVTEGLQREMAELHRKIDRSVEEKKKEKIQADRKKKKNKNVSITHQTMPYISMMKHKLSFSASDYTMDLPTPVSFNIYTKVAYDFFFHKRMHLMDLENEIVNGDVNLLRLFACRDKMRVLRETLDEGMTQLETLHKEKRKNLPEISFLQGFITY